MPIVFLFRDLKMDPQNDSLFLLVLVLRNYDIELIFGYGLEIVMKLWPWL